MADPIMPTADDLHRMHNYTGETIVDALNSVPPHLRGPLCVWFISAALKGLALEWGPQAASQAAYALADEMATTEAEK